MQSLFYYARLLSPDLVIYLFIYFNASSWHFIIVFAIVRCNYIKLDSFVPSS